MKKTKQFLSILAVIIFALPLFAGGQQEAVNEGPVSEQATSFVTVTDFLGREVTVQMPVESVAFTHYATAEALKILDAWNLVVARDGYTGNKLLYPNIEDIPALTSLMGNCYEPNMELLLELSPDLLVLEAIPMPGMEDLIKQLGGIIPIVAVQTYDPEELFNSFDILGKLLDREAESKAFTGWIKDVQHSLLDKTGDLTDSEKTTIFFKTGYGNVEELGTFSDEMSYLPARNRYSGCINIAADVPSQGGWVAALDPEWLAAQDMEVLIIGDPLPGKYGALVDDPSDLETIREKVLRLPVFADTTAVKTGRVYMLADEFFGTPRHIIGFAYLAKWFHPDLFEDMDPAGLHQEYFDKFLRVDADVINKGYFVYPRE